MYKSDIVALLEPRISGETTDQVCKRIGKGCWIRVEASGFNGGYGFFGTKIVLKWS